MADFSCFATLVLYGFAVVSFSRWHILLGVLGLLLSLDAVQLAGEHAQWFDLEYHSDDVVIPIQPVLDVLVLAIERVGVVLVSPLFETERQRRDFLPELPYLRFSSNRKTAAGSIRFSSRIAQDHCWIYPWFTGQNHRTAKGKECSVRDSNPGPCRERAR